MRYELFCMLLFAGLAAGACVSVNSTDMVNQTYNLTNLTDKCLYVADLNATIQLPKSNTTVNLTFGGNYTCIDDIVVNAPAFPKISENRNLVANSTYNYTAYDLNITCNYNVSCSAPPSCLRNITLSPTFGSTVNDASSNVSCKAPEFPAPTDTIAYNANWSVTSVANLLAWDENKTLAPNEVVSLLGGRAIYRAPANASCPTCPSCLRNVSATLDCVDTKMYNDSYTNTTIRINCTRNINWSITGTGNKTDEVTNTSCFAFAPTPLNITKNQDVTLKCGDAPFFNPDTNITVRLNCARNQAWALASGGSAVDVVTNISSTCAVANATCATCPTCPVCENTTYAVANAGNCRPYCHDNATYPVVGEYNRDGVIAYLEMISENPNTTKNFWNCSKLITLGAAEENQTTYCADTLMSLCPDNLFDGNFGQCVQSKIASYETAYTDCESNRQDLNATLEGCRKGENVSSQIADTLVKLVAAGSVALILASFVAFFWNNKRRASLQDREVPTRPKRPIPEIRRGEEVR